VLAAELTPAYLRFVADAVAVVYPGVIVEIGSFASPFRSRRDLAKAGGVARITNRQ
jgi:hypothetical protein